MSITLTGTGGYFTRLGSIIGEFNRVAALYGSALVAGFESIWVQYASSDQAAVTGLPSAVTAYQSTAGSYQAALAAAGQQSTLLQVSDSYSVVPYTFPQAISLLVDQMDATAQTVNRPTLSSTVTAGTPAGGSNVGNAQFAVSFTNIYGDPLDTTIAETLTATCTATSGTYGNTFSLVGQAAVSSGAYNWPQGSGTALTIAAIDPAVNGTVTDGGFAYWGGTGSNTPTYWSIANGTAGTQVQQGVSAGVRTGTSSANLVSDGTSLTKLYQAVSLSPSTVYAVTFQAKVSATDSSGVLQISLQDGSGNVLQNYDGANQAYTRLLSGAAGQVLASGYTQFTAFFQTPRILPTNTYLYVGFSVAPASGKTLSLDLIQIATPTPLYGASGTGTSGPWVSCFAGSTQNAVGDGYSIAIASSAATQSFVLGMERLFQLRSQGVYLPSSTSPTISDSLVTH